jgi:hypothetical protein
LTVWGLQALQCVDGGRRQEILNAGTEGFRSARPFPHVVMDGFLAPDVAESVLREFRIPDDQAIYWSHYNEKKRGLNRMELMGPVTRAVINELHGATVLGFLEALTATAGLIPDPQLDGAGLHETAPGGFLNMHVDFLTHTLHDHWSRQINLLLYLNKEWAPSFNGYIQFWDMDEKKCYAKIEPSFNRCVIFQTTRRSWHGYPEHVACPPDRSRKSIALYYYRQESAALALQPTYYRYLPTDPLMKKALVVLDRTALKAYSFLKKHSLISDQWISRVVRIFRR